jgi:hypothetical protein
MNLEKNKLYNLIRYKAGSKMLRQAEEVNLCIRLEYCIEENIADEYCQKIIGEYKRLYPQMIQEIPMDYLTISEALDISLDDLTHIPYIYVHILETLASTNKYIEDIVNNKIAVCEASLWRLPLPLGVENKDSFNRVYSDFLKDESFSPSRILLS